MKNIIFFSVAVLFVPIVTAAQGGSPFTVISLAEPRLTGTPAPEVGDDNAESPERTDDPAYSLYKEAYNLVLEENWDKAREKLGDVIKKYPKSEYVDDAEYWSAYSQMHVNKKKAVGAYKTFIEKNPSSSYYDDAVNDLNSLDSGFYVTSVGNGHLAVSGIPGHGYAYTLAPSMRRAQRELKTVMRSMKTLTPQASTMLASPFFPGEAEENLDPETRLKMDALHALGSSKEDSSSFNALKDVAVDRSQARQLRLAAMEELADFRKHDPLPIFLEIAKNDTSEEVQNAAVDFIGMLPKDKNRSVETLIQLFDAIPASRPDQRENIFYSIAEVGNNKAVDFLAHVARMHESYDLRSQAIYYLGNIGNERARGALYDILRGKEKTSR